MNKWMTWGAHPNFRKHPDVLNLPWSFAICCRGTSREAAKPCCFGWSWRPGSTTRRSHSWSWRPGSIVLLWTSPAPRSAKIEDNGYDLVKLRGRGDAAAGTVAMAENWSIDTMRFEQLAVQLYSGGDTLYRTWYWFCTLFFQHIIFASDGWDLQMFQFQSRTYLKGFARLTVAAAAAAEAMDADEESVKRSQKVRIFDTWKSRSDEALDPSQLPRYSESRGPDSEEEDACAS